MIKMVDEFQYGTAVGGNIGEFDWNVTMLGSGVDIARTPQSSVSDGIHFYIFSTAPVSDSGMVMFLGSNSPRPLVNQGDGTWEAIFYVRISNFIGSEINVGIHTGSAVANADNMISLTFDARITSNWFGKIVNDGTLSTFATTVSMVPREFHKIAIRKTLGDQIIWFISGNPIRQATLPSSLASNLVSNLTPGISIRTHQNLSRAFSVDRFVFNRNS